MRAETINYGLTEDEIYSAVRQQIEQFTELPVVYGNQSAPLPTECLVITMLHRQAKSLPNTTYDKDKGIEISVRTYFVKFQVDIYGKQAGQIYDAIVTLSLNPTSYSYQQENTPSVSLIGLNERGRMPFTNEQQNYENRYTLEMEFSIYNEVSRTIDFIESINVKTVEVK